MNAAQNQQQQPGGLEAGAGGAAAPTVPLQNAPWWLKYAAKGLGTIAGVLAMGLGAFNCITVTPKCLVAGILQMIAGFLVTVFEAPYLCMFLDFVQKISGYLDNKPLYMKGGFFVLLAIPPVLLCGGNASVIIGSGLIFVSGVLYGLMGLGKKASREEMERAAAANNDRSPIIGQAQPMGTA